MSVRSTKITSISTERFLHFLLFFEIVLARLRYFRRELPNSLVYLFFFPGFSLIIVSILNICPESTHKYTSLIPENIPVSRGYACSEVSVNFLLVMENI